MDDMKHSSSFLVLASILFFSSCGQSTRSRMLLSEEVPKTSALSETSEKQDVFCSKTKAIKIAYDYVKSTSAKFSESRKEEVENIFSTNTFQSYIWNEQKQDQKVTSKKASFSFLVEFPTAKYLTSVDVDLLTCKLTSAESRAALKVDLNGHELD